MADRMDTVTAQQMGITIYLNGQPVCAAESHFLAEMGPVSGDGVSYVIFTKGVTPRRKDRVVTGSTEFIITRVQRYIRTSSRRNNGVAMETFTWKVKPGMNIESEPRVRSIRFGDGYEQRRPDSLNSGQEKYSITLSAKNTDAHQIRNFLEKHGGVSAFFWTPPYQSQEITVLCRKWSVVVDLVRTEITAEFERVLV